MLRYSLLVLLGACSYGILAIFVKLAYAEGFSLGEVIGVPIFVRLDYFACYYTSIF